MTKYLDYNSFHLRYSSTICSFCNKERKCLRLVGSNGLSIPCCPECLREVSLVAIWGYNDDN